MDSNAVIVKESKELDLLKKKMIGFEEDLLKIKSFNLSKIKQKTSVEDRLQDSGSLIKKSCDICESNFIKNCEFEKHMKEDHETAEIS